MGRRTSRAAAGAGRKPSIPASKIEEIVDSPATVQRICSARGLQPHRVETFKLSNDAGFEDKLVDVVGLYLNPPENAIVLCVDEETPNAVGNFEFECAGCASGGKESAVTRCIKGLMAFASCLCGRVRGSGEPSGRVVGGSVAGGCGAWVGGGVRSVRASGAPVCERGVGAAGWCGGSGAHGGVHGAVGAVVDRGSARARAVRAVCR